MDPISIPPLRIRVVIMKIQIPENIINAAAFVLQCISA